MSTIGQFPLGLCNALLTARKNYRLFPVANVNVLDTFSAAGSKKAANGTKCQFALDLGGGQYIDMSAVIPLTGSAWDAVKGIKLDKNGQQIVDSFYASELWLACLVRKPEKARIALLPVRDSSKCEFFIVFEDNKGFTYELRGVFNATDTLILARALYLGVGHVFTDAQQQQFIDLLIEARLTDQHEAAQKKQAA